VAGLKVITPPAIEPVTWQEVAAQLRYDDPDQAIIDQIEALITAAREWCEGYQNRAYVTQTLELALDQWPCGGTIELPRPPLQSVTSVSYTDADGNAETWDSANYIVDDYDFVGRVVRKRTASWPSVRLAEVNGVKVLYVAGYGDAAEDVPQRIRQAIIALVAHWFDHGRCDPPPAVYALLDLDRVVPV